MATFLAVTDTSQLWHRCIPPPEPIVLEFGTFAVTITRPAGWPYAQTPAITSSHRLRFIIHRAKVIPGTDPYERASDPLVGTQERNFRTETSR